MMPETETVVEIAVFRPVAGASREAVLAAARDLQDWVARQPGFLARTLYEDREQGTYVDVAHWASEADARRAAAAFETVADTCALMALVEPGSERMLHVCPVVAFDPAGTL